MADKKNDGRTELFKRLTQLFRGGPSIKRKVRAFRTPVASSAAEVFKKSYSQVYSNALNAYGQYDRMSRYADFCFAPDALVYTTRGVYTIKQLADDASFARCNVYAYDLFSKKVVIAEAHSPRVAKDGIEQDIVRVTFDDGGHIDTTPDHQFLLKDGTYKQAIELTAGTSLQPFYNRDIGGDGYRWIYTNDRERSKGGWISEHLMVMEHFLGRQIAKGEVVHHKDFNRKNNMIENLQLMTEDEHKRYHAQLNNRNKFGKQGFKGIRKKPFNPTSRTDITFERILKVAIENDFSKLKTRQTLKADNNVVNRRLREHGFKNWTDFASKKDKINDFISHQAIVSETRSPTIEEILAVASSCKTLYDVCAALQCTTGAVSRRLMSNGYGTWTNLKQTLTGNVYSQHKRGPKPDSSLTYQMVCDAYEKGMSYQELAQKLNVSHGKVRTRIQNEGYKSYSEWTNVFQNHKVVSVERLTQKSVVYNITVEGFHNLAMGSLNPSSSSDVREYSMVFVKQSEAEYTPEIASALDVYSEEASAADDQNNVLHVYSNNPKIQSILNELYHDVLNVEFNITPWTRNLVKFGDLFLFIDVHPEQGVLNVMSMPVNEVEREEGWDPNDPFAVRFRWTTQGNKILESWQVAHFRLMGNDAFLPYGSSVLESARRIWRQLILIEDAMLVYRVVRSPERRVFYIDVGTVAAEDIPNYMEAAQTKLKRSPVIDKSSGRVDLRYNPLCHFPNDFIYLCDGTRKQIIDVVENWNEFDGASVWSLDKDCNVVPTKLIWAGKTMDDATFIEVELDDGQVIKTTPEHRWLLRDGTEIQAKDLSPGASLMPFYQRKAESLTRRFSPKVESNYYIDVYHPGNDSWKSGHQITACSVFGKHEWPYIVHHKNHVKHDNRPENLEWLTQTEHAKVHRDIIIAYNQSPEGRKKSSETFKTTWQKDGYRNIIKGLWTIEDIRKKRVDALTFKIDSNFIHHTLRALDALGTTAREYEIRQWLNDDLTFNAYLRDLNPSFKNGFTETVSKAGFLKFLRANNIKNVRAAKDLYVSIKAPWDAIISFCEEMHPETLNAISRFFGISKYDLNRLIEQHGLTNDGFKKKYIPETLTSLKNINCAGCGIIFSVSRISSQRYHDRDCYFNHMGRRSLNVASLGKNHSVVSVRVIEHGGPAYGLTVENSTHTLAIGGVKLHNKFGEFDELTTVQPVDIIGTGVFMKNSVDEDYFIPVRGSESGTKIDTLAGGQHVSDIADVEYIQKKLFAALKVPRAYLGYDESLSSKSTLAQEDIRFSRSIARIQRVLVSELQKIGIIHLFAHGFEGDDLADFSIHLSNPSTVAQMQKLELWRMKFEIAGTVPEGLTDRDFIRREIFKLTDEQIDSIKEGRISDRIEDMELEQAEVEGDGGGSGGGGGGAGGLGGLPGGGGGEPAFDSGGADEEPEGGSSEISSGTGGGDESGGEEDLFAGDVPDGQQLLTSADDDEDDAVGIESDAGDDDVSTHVEPRGPSLARALNDIGKASASRSGRKGPVGTTPLSKALYDRGRRRHHGASTTHIPDFRSSLVSPLVSGDDSPIDTRFFNANPFKMGENRSLGDIIEPVAQREKQRLSADVRSMIEMFRRSKQYQRSIHKNVMSQQTVMTEGEIDLMIEDDGILDITPPNDELIESLLVDEGISDEPKSDVILEGDEE